MRQVSSIHHIRALVNRSGKSGNNPAYRSIEKYGSLHKNKYRAVR